MPFLYKVICERFTLLSHLSIELKCQHFHKLHHTYKQPTAFSVTAIHPVEFLNIQAIYIAPMFLMRLYARKLFLFFVQLTVLFNSTSPAVYCFMLLYIYYHGIIDHSGITFKVKSTNHFLNR